MTIQQVIRMYRTLVGEAGFRKGMDLYFKRHDGQAVSCDDFRAAMADANGVNLDQFERWYLQVLLLLLLLPLANAVTMATTTVNIVIIATAVTTTVTRLLV